MGDYLEMSNRAYNPIFGFSRHILGTIGKNSVKVSVGGVVERSGWFAKAWGKGCISGEGSEGTMRGDLKWCEGI